jgi:hypothetical protein
VWCHSAGSCQDKQLLLVRIGFEGRPESIRKLPRDQLKPGYINRMFQTDVEFLKVVCVCVCGQVAGPGFCSYRLWGQCATCGAPTLPPEHPTDPPSPPPHLPYRTHPPTHPTHPPFTPGHPPPPLHTHKHTLAHNQDSVFNFCIAPGDWEARCGPPPTTYYIIPKVWAAPQLDPLEDARYVGTASVFLLQVPSEVEEAALRLWLDLGLKEHVPGYEAAKVRMLELQEESKYIEASLESLTEVCLPGVSPHAACIAWAWAWAHSHTVHGEWAASKLVSC